MNAEEFILANTSPAPCHNVKNISIYQAGEIHDLWHKTQDELDLMSLPPPFWAFAWAGGEALARYILENAHIVRGKKILDFASGSGLVAIAAAKAGASIVTANDIDGFACTAINLNAALNHVNLEIISSNLLSEDIDFDVILAGDIFYDRCMSQNVTSWLTKMACKGILVLAGDPGRAYVPYDKLAKRAEYNIKTLKSIEDQTEKSVQIWQFIAKP